MRLNWFSSLNLTALRCHSVVDSISYAGPGALVAVSHCAAPTSSVTYVQCCRSSNASASDALLNLKMPEGHSYAICTDIGVCCHAGMESARGVGQTTSK